MKTYLRDHISSLTAYTSARDEFNDLRDQVFLDANENPYENNYNRYPDPYQRDLKDKIAAALRSYEESGLTVEERNGKIYISMEAKLLFKSGSTNIEAAGKKAIIDLSNVIQKESDWEIVVEGHTDTDALNSSSHPKSNWELSVLRSTAVVDVMLSNSKLSPKQVMAAGRGEFHPIDKNNKAKNRRIEVIISPNLNELFEIISN